MNIANRLNTDIVIVGAGPAGSMASLTANFYNLNTILIDKQCMPRDKVCGDAVLRDSVLTLFKLINLEVPSEILEAQNHRKFRLFYDEEYVDELKSNIFCIERKKLDDILYQAQKNNSDSNICLDSTHITSIKKQGDGYSLSIIKSENCVEIYTKYLIGADGHNSMVRNLFFPQLKLKRHIASRCYIKSTKKFDLSVHFIPEIEHGYFWIFKLRENEYNTGVFMVENKVQNKGLFKSHQKYLKLFFNHNLVKKEFKSSIIPSNVNILDGLVKDKCLLIGDSAGMCDDLFGHGIDSAMIAAYCAIKSIADFESEKFDYCLEEMYHYNIKGWMKEMFASTKNLNSFFKSTDKKLAIKKITKIIQKG